MEELTGAKEELIGAKEEPIVVGMEDGALTQISIILVREEGLTVHIVMIWVIGFRLVINCMGTQKAIPKQITIIRVLLLIMHQRKD